MIVRYTWFGYDNRDVNWFLALTGAHRFQADVQDILVPTLTSTSPLLTYYAQSFFSASL